MQEERSDKSKINTRRYSTKEERQGHVDSWKKSGLTMSEYCRKHNIALASLSDWKHSILRSSSQFKPISSLSPREIVTNPTHLVEIIVDQRIKIRFQHVSDASLVVSVVKELLICS